MTPSYCANTSKRIDCWRLCYPVGGSAGASGERLLVSSSPMRANRTKQLLREGKTAFGCFVRPPDPTLVEVMGHHGWDFFIFDGEHGTLEPRACEDMVRAAELRGVAAVVRVPVNQPHVILR